MGIWKEERGGEVRKDFNVTFLHSERSIYDEKSY